MAKKGIDTVFVHYGIRRENMTVAINAHLKTSFYNRPLRDLTATACNKGLSIIHSSHL